MTPRVLVCGGLRLAQSLWAIHRGFERAGCNCLYLQTSEITDPDRRKQFIPGLEDSIIDAAKESDLLFWWQPQSDAPVGLLQEIKRRQPHLPLVMLTIDDPQMWDMLNAERISIFDFAVTCCESSVPNYEKHGIEPIVGYPPCDATIHGEATPTDDCADIAFVATNTYDIKMHPAVFADRIDIVRRLMPLGSLTVYGTWGHGKYDWHRLGEDVKDAVYGGHKDYSTELPGIYRGTRINLSSHFRPRSRMPFNERTIACMGSGGFTLCDRIEGIEEVFKDGEHIALWDSLDEVEEKTRWYLAHKKKRAKIALAGQEKCQKLFNNERLARTILSKALGEAQGC